MSNKFKLDYMAWYEKTNCTIFPMHLYDYFTTVDEEIIDADDAVSDLLSGIGYSSQINKASDCYDNLGKLNGYTLSLPNQIEYEIDEPFYKAANRAAQYLSEIKLDDFETDNNLNIQVEQTVSGHGYTGTILSEKGKLSFEDFLGSAVGEGGSLVNVNCVEEFANLFKEDYTNNKADLEAFFGEAESVEEFLDNIEKFGEFEHDLDVPFLNFISGALDLTIVKPLIEAYVGRDLITHERLTDLERGFKVGGAVIDIVTFGTGAAALKLGKMSFKQACKVGGRYVVIQTCGDLSGYTMGYVSNELGMPKCVTLVLSLGANAGVSWKLAGKSYEQFAKSVDLDDVNVQRSIVVTNNDVLKQFNLTLCREEMVGSLSDYRKALLNNPDVKNMSKICSTVDAGNLEIKGLAGSGIWKYNPTIIDPTGVNPKTFCNSIEDYTNYYRSLLTDEYVDKLPESFLRGKNKQNIKEDFAKLRADIEKTKMKAKSEGRYNQFGEPSFQYDWNVDNCAEIWAARDAILKGARYDDLVFRTENLQGGFAEPCKNCQVTFEGFYNIDY